jgi:hypothetical protein
VNRALGTECHASTYYRKVPPNCSGRVWQCRVPVDAQMVLSSNLDVAFAFLEVQRSKPE